MDNVVPNFKPFGRCGCADDCGLEGHFKRPWKSNGRICVRNCACKQCKGAKSKRSGGLAQRTSRKRHGTKGSSIATGHEEHEVSLFFGTAAQTDVTYLCSSPSRPP